MHLYEIQCLVCGACRTERLDQPPDLATDQECVMCHLHRGRQYPPWRWRRLEPGTPAEQLAALRSVNALCRALEMLRRDW